MTLLPPQTSMIHPSERLCDALLYIHLSKLHRAERIDKQINSEDYLT